MSAIKLTLQNRITTLMVVSSLILISAFTFIQLNNQLSNLTRHYSLQANLSTIIVKNTLENIIRQAETYDTTDYMNQTLSKLKETGVIKEAIIFNKTGEIMASTEALSSNNTNIVRYKDLEEWQELENAEQEHKWFVSRINKIDRILDIFIALKNNNLEPITYIAKVSFSLGSINEALAGVYGPVVFATLIIILANILIGYLLSKAVIGPIKTLNQITKIIADGDLSIRTDIRTNDELQDLGQTFNYMTEQLIKMRERAENANPLTKLPGNIVIHEQVERRIKENKQFMVIYCDLDNFKAFNDKYGIAKGDEAIKITAQIFKDVIQAKGNPEDFVGHEGGDDFMLLTTPEKAQDIADYIIKEFDQKIRVLYSNEDLCEGCITAHARDGSITKFPVMTISLAGVTNSHRPITNYAEVTNIAAEVKKKAKSIEESVFVVDKRRN